MILASDCVMLCLCHALLCAVLKQKEAIISLSLCCLLCASTVRRRSGEEKSSNLRHNPLCSFDIAQEPKILWYPNEETKWSRPDAKLNCIITHTSQLHSHPHPYLPLLAIHPSVHPYMRVAFINTSGIPYQHTR